MSDTPRILYCHCQYAKVLPKETKEAVLKQLCASNIEFLAVPDLCELSARRDPLLKELAASGPLKIAACFPRAIKWLFNAANAPLPVESTQVCNLRTASPSDACAELLHSPFSPNLPPGKSSP